LFEKGEAGEETRKALTSRKKHATISKRPLSASATPTAVRLDRQQSFGKRGLKAALRAGPSTGW